MVGSLFWARRSVVLEEREEVTYIDEQVTIDVTRTCIRIVATAWEVGSGIEVQSLRIHKTFAAVVSVAGREFLPPSIYSHDVMGIVPVIPPGSGHLLLHTVSLVGYFHPLI